MSSRRAFMLLLVLAVFAGALARPASGDDVVFRSVEPGLELKFPRDHGAHREYSTEWWYFTGHLTADSGKTFGFELVFFRVGVNPFRESRSAWATSSVYLSHFAVTDDTNQRFYQFERRSRGSFGEAGASEEGLRCVNGPWVAEMEGETITLVAKENDLELRLSVRPKKPLVLHGDNGLSRKGSGPGEASYYTSFTRLEGDGTLRIGARSERITSASAWFDHEMTSSSLARGTQGWDWFALQLDDGSELMLYQLRGKNGEASPFSSGTYVSPSGESRHLSRGDFAVEVLERWKSADSSAVYPAKWRIAVPGLGVAAVVTPTVADQELETGSSTGVRYWEGRCRLSSEDRERQIGSAYVELVGY